MVSISLRSFWSFGLLPLKKICSVHLRISSLGHWCLGSLVFEYILNINSCQKYSWQSFSPFCGRPLHFSDFLFFRSILVSCSPICQPFLLVAEPFEFHLERHCLRLLVPLYLALESEFQVLLWSLIHFFLLLFICAYKAWFISPPCPHPLPYHPLHPLPLPPNPSIPSRNYFALISNFVVERV
jgi:hypothetical protein